MLLESVLITISVSVHLVTLAHCVTYLSLLSVISIHVKMEATAPWLQRCLSANAQKTTMAHDVKVSGNISYGYRYSYLVWCLFIETIKILYGHLKFA